MDIVTSKNTLALFMRMTSKGSTEPIVPTRKVKSDPEIQENYKYFERVSPESVGVPSETVKAFFGELKEERDTRINTALVLKDGKVIGEAEYYPYRFDTWHVLYSFTKTVTSLAIGILIGQGKLSKDDKVQKFFPDKGLSALNIGLRGLTVEHLLNMTSGVKFNEVGSAVETDWVRCFLESVPKTEPGTTFEYNSLNTYMLSAIVTKITGRTVDDFLNEHLFEPMGIVTRCWEACPKGISCGGWGLYLLTEDMAKLGQLLLQEGEWEGNQLVPRDYIRDMTSSHATVPKNVSTLTYGYQIWISDSPKFYCFNGLYGQNVLVFPESGIVIALTSSNDDMFHGNIEFDICRKYFGKEFAHKLTADPAAYSSLKKLQKKLRRPPYTKHRIIRKLCGGDILPKQCASLDGLSYSFGKDAAKAGLLPLTVQATHNNYSAGIRRISFEKNNSRFYVTVTEGDGIFRIPVGFEKARYADLKLGENTYKVASLGKFAFDDDGVEYLKVTIYYLEMGSARILKFYCGSKLRLMLGERPGARFFMNTLELFTHDLKNLPMIKGMLESGGDELLELAVRAFFEPEVTGKAITK